MTVRRFQWYDKDGNATGILRKIQIEAEETQHEIQCCLVETPDPGVGKMAFGAFAHRDDGSPQVEVYLEKADVRKLIHSLTQLADQLDKYEARWGLPQ